jgi:DMSO/TMAO reductase YedYZ molybdopterin-dependent catalytic subunit
VKTSRGQWSLAGVVAGLAGLAISYVVASVLSVKESPVVAVAQGIIRITPGSIVEKLISVVGTLDKPLLVVGVVVVSSVVFAWAGRLARRAWWAPAVVFAVLGVIGGIAVAAEPGSTAIAGLPVGIGFVACVVILSLLTEPLERIERTRTELEEQPQGSGAPGRAAARIETSGRLAQTRRTFMVRVGLVGAAAVVLGVAGRVVGSGRRNVEQARALLRLDGVTRATVPAGAGVGVDGISPWMTPVEEFYRIDTAVVVPVIEPRDWKLRIHGMVEKEIVLSYDDLIGRQITESWITLNCVSNPVGGDLIGNAWWSGVRLADILAEAGVSGDADAVLQTSDDGWTCGTPLAALTDGRNAMLAIAMDGRPLPVEHGFPVRTVVPGLYGYVSGTKWVVDMEVTRFDRIEAYWTQRGWGVKGPQKISSRVDVPRSGESVKAGDVVFGGVAWMQNTGISGVQVSVDGGAWQDATIADTGLVDTWVQWTATVPVEAGDHLVRVRATDATGAVQTGTVRDVLPDGATGYDTRDFTAT